MYNCVCCIINLPALKEVPEFLNASNQSGIRIENSGITVLNRKDLSQMKDNFLTVILLPDNKISKMEDSTFEGKFLF